MNGKEYDATQKRYLRFQAIQQLSISTLHYVSEISKITAQLTGVSRSELARRKTKILRDHDMAKERQSWIWSKAANQNAIQTFKFAQTYGQLKGVEVFVESLGMLISNE